jgi:arylformamidase
MGRLIDLSHTIEDGLITYKGLPAPVICDFLSRKASREIYADGTEFQIGKIEMVGNSGTYLDTPFHRFADGMDLSEIDLRSVASLPAVLVNAPFEAGRTIGPEFFAGAELAGRAVLVHTGWDRNWRTDAYFEGHPFLTAAAAELLVQSGAVLVGIDSLNIDDTADMRRPVHTTLLGAGILIVEHLTGLQHLPVDGFRFTAAPVKVKGFGTFPVRAFAELTD